MSFCKHIRTQNGAVTAGIIVLLISSFLICGCLDVEPEELPPQTVSPTPAITISPAISINTNGNVTSAPRLITITSPRQTGLFTEQRFPPEVEDAIGDFVDGKTDDTVNGFLRWESVRARTNLSDASRIKEQIRRIDYAVFNTTIKENIRVYVGVSGEQAKRIRNDSVFSENGYITASSDPSVIYRGLVNTGRDSGGYLTMCVIDIRKGGRVLYVNATEREFLLPHGGIWDFAGEETYETLEFSRDSIPRYAGIPLKGIRLISTKEHP